METAKSNTYTVCHFLQTFLKMLFWTYSLMMNMNNKHFFGVFYTNSEQAIIM